MKRILAVAGWFLFVWCAAAQEAGPSLYDLKYKYEKALLRIDGVREVSVGGTNGELRLVIHVESEEAREAVRTLLGNQIPASQLHFIVSTERNGIQRASSDCEHCSCPCHRNGVPGRTVAAPRTEDPPPSPEELCDMVREVKGLPKRKDVKNGVVCQQMIGWTNDPEKIRWLNEKGIPHWDSREMGGFFTAYTYVKHRQFCPFGQEDLMEGLRKLTPTK